MRARARRGAESKDRERRGKRLDRRARSRHRRRGALQDGEAQVLGRAVAVVKRRAAAGRIAVVVVMMMMMMDAGPAEVVVVIATWTAAFAVVVVVVIERVGVVVTMLVGERELADALLPGLLGVVNQGVEPGHHQPGQGHGGQAGLRRPPPPLSPAGLTRAPMHHPLFTIRRPRPAGSIESADGGRSTEAPLPSFPPGRSQRAETAAMCFSARHHVPWRPARSARTPSRRPARGCRTPRPGRRR
jgi:hypothetical protein